MTRDVTRWTMVTGIGLAAAMLGACSSTTAGTPAPASTDTSPDSTSSQPALDAEPYRAKPCDLLPTNVLQSLGFSAPGEPVSDGQNGAVTGQSCAWDDVASQARTIQVQIPLKNTDPQHPGLTPLFDKLKAGHMAYVEPTDVLGYQAAFSDIKDSRADGKCGITVVINETQNIIATADGFPGAENSCGTAKQLAEAAVKTLGGA